MEGFKRCTKCGKEHLATAKFFRLRTMRGKPYMNSMCRECEKEYKQTPKYKASASAYNRRPERKAYMVEYQKKPELVAYHKAYSQTPEQIKRKKIREQSPEYKAREKAFQQSPRGIAQRKAKHERRRARLHSLPAVFSHKDWQRCIEYWDGCCAACGRPQGLWHSLAIDHWIPLASPDCPGTIPTNILPLCHGVGGCNNSKNDSNPHEWLIEKFGKRKAAQIEKRIQAYFESLNSLS